MTRTNIVSAVKIRRRTKVLHVARRIELPKLADANRELALAKRTISHMQEQINILQKQLSFAAAGGEGVACILKDFREAIDQNLNYLDSEHASRIFESMFDSILFDCPVPEKVKKSLYFGRHVKGKYG